MGTFEVGLNTFILHYDTVTSLREPETKCGSLNVTGSYNPIGSDTMRRFCWSGMALMEEVCQCGVGL